MAKVVAAKDAVNVRQCNSGLKFLTVLLVLDLDKLYCNLLYFCTKNFCDKNFCVRNDLHK